VQHNKSFEPNLTLWLKMNALAAADNDLNASVFSIKFGYYQLKVNNKIRKYV